MEIELKDIKYANLGRRVISIILDLLFFGVIFCFLYLPLVEGFIDIGFHNNQILHDIKALQVESGLFVDRSESNQKELSNVSLIGYDELTDENGYYTFDSYLVYMNAIYSFYTNENFSYHDELMNMIFNKTNVSDEEFNYWFNSKVLYISQSDDFDVYCLHNNNLYSSPLNNCFVKDKIIFDGIIYVKNGDDIRKNQDYILAATKIFSDTLDFPGTYQEALFRFRNTNVYNTFYKNLERISRYEAYISIAIVSIIYFLAIPLLFKNGETFGMKIMHIGLVNSLEYQVSKPQVLLKYLIIIVEIYISLFTFLLIFFVDYLIMIFSKRHRSISDLIAVTVMIDTKLSAWFASRAVEEKLIKQIEDNLNNDGFYDKQGKN